MEKLINRYLSSVPINRYLSEDLRIGLSNHLVKKLFGFGLNLDLSEISVKGERTILTFADGKKITTLTTNVFREDN